MKDLSLADKQASSYLSGNSAAYMESLYEAYLCDPNTVSDCWRDCFDKLPKASSNGSAEISHDAVQAYFISQANQPDVAAPEFADLGYSHKQAAVLSLINAYRSHGHLHSILDPLSLHEIPQEPTLSLAYHGLTQADLNTEFATGCFDGLSARATLSDIQTALEKTYCQHIGAEFRYIDNETEVSWLEQHFEANCATPQLNSSEKNRLLQRLNMADGLEKYLGRRYVGQKRFSLEGGDSLIPALDDLVQQAGKEGVKECVFGMAHRGRLNVLTNILGKAPQELFDEFDIRDLPEDMSGDVKYHLGFSSDIRTPGGSVHLALAFNPSHLEIINPVVEGSVRARQARRSDLSHQQVLPVLIHGDSAFAGQGVVMETFNMSQARNFTTGGTIHFIVNNQVGFTTSNPQDTRSTRYASDVAKMIQAPIFHVNGDDPESVIFVTRLALHYRMRFNRDVVIDLICYRRHGHNEADEPSGTQPLMYAKIKQHPTPFALYSKQLLKEGVIEAMLPSQLEETYRKQLDSGLCTVDDIAQNTERNAFTADWSPYLEGHWRDDANTAVSADQLVRLGQQLLTIPEGFTLQKQVGVEMKNRQKMLSGELPLNWGMAENLAYATLLNAGYHVRLTGQDSGRGTFAHRHAQLHDVQNGDVYIPLQHIADNKAQMTLTDSLLSEEAVMGFEYGYASTAPDTLVLWEAQFGDFFNGAQVVVDQFISSGWQKWGRLCGLTLLLPHGYEGAGPEHSSARLERFMQLCAEDNMQVCVPTTPAQIFHLLRRQMIRHYRVPLIVMSPKSLLRHKLATSSLTDLSNGQFQLIMPEVDDLDKQDVKRIILCSGKVYYDLLQKRRELNKTDVAILRIEQLYPFPESELLEYLSVYSNATDIIWCQEEPKNQGAWFSIRHKLEVCAKENQTLQYCGRQLSASPAAGYMFLHLRQQEKLVLAALG